MKTLILTMTSGFLFLMTFESCNFFSSGSASLGVNATGVAYEVVVVAEHALWDDAAGSRLKDELQMPVAGLPQIEPAMRISYVEPANFNGMMTYVRNILIATVDESRYTKVSFTVEKDKWANGQVVIYLTTPDKGLLADYLDQHPGQLVNYFSRVETERMANVLQKTHSLQVFDKLKDKFDISLYSPTDFGSFKDTTDFFWTSNNAKKGRMDLVVYTFPYTDANTFTKDYLIAMRDSILGANIPGSFPGSHMATDTAMVTYAPVTLQGKYCGVLRGLWSMEGDMMGGPFVSYARLDEVHNRIVVSEGFVYSPETDKRSYIRRLEASLYTLRLPGEVGRQQETEAAAGEI
ncbi:MAG: DUF4837 family protein [Tannerella sp.]|jgi:hypothetical protein|nr:DUF4837 family protein [Tannerella sp.]